MKLVFLVVGLALTGAVVCADSEVTSGPAADVSQGRALAADVADADRIRANLTALRARYGRPPAGTFVVAEPMLQRARVRILAGHPPNVVLEDQMQLAADNGERDIACWSIDASSADSVRFPVKLVKSRRANVAIVVVRGFPAEGPPVMHVLFAMAEPDQSSD
jgi:hypothetical protein